MNNPSPSSSNTQLLRRIYLLAGFSFCIYFLLFIANGWVEGSVTAVVQFADGTPAPCATIQFQPVEIIGPYSGKVRTPIAGLAHTAPDGFWHAFDQWPFGRYRLIVFADQTENHIVTQQEFTIWPMVMTHVVLEIDENYQPRFLPQHCLERLQIVEKSSR